jgi:hypothetical protein
VGGLDAGDHADRAAGVVVREQQVMGRLGEKAIGRRRQRRRIEEVRRPVHGRGIHDPLDPHARQPRLRLRRVVRVARTHES